MEEVRDRARSGGGLRTSGQDRSFELVSVIVGSGGELLRVDHAGSAVLPSAVDVRMGAV